MTDKNATADNTPQTPGTDTSSNAIAWLEEVRALIAEGYAVEFSPKGYSMWPALRPDTDTVRLEATDKYSRSDIVLALCHTPYGVFMHRVADVLPHGVVLMGDSNLYQTELCLYSDIIGKTTAIMRHGRDVSDSVSSKILTRIQKMPPIFRRLFVRAVKLYLKHRTK